MTPVECRCGTAGAHWESFLVESTDGRAWPVAACCPLAAGEYAEMHARTVEHRPAVIQRVVAE